MEEIINEKCPHHYGFEDADTCHETRANCNFCWNREVNDNG